MLSDLDISIALSTKEIKIDGFDVSRMQPCSYDVTLGQSFTYFEPKYVVDPRGDNSNRHSTLVISPTGSITIHPGQMILGTTREKVTLSSAIAARIEGKSSLGRLGLLIHTTAGFIDAGFSGEITLELVNLLKVPIILYAGMPIAQLSFFRLDSPAIVPYAGKYQNQAGATASQYHRNFVKE